jgi:hypothetical protein
MLMFTYLLKCYRSNPGPYMLVKVSSTELHSKHQFFGFDSSVTTMQDKAWQRV